MKFTIQCGLEKKHIITSLLILFVLLGATGCGVSDGPSLLSSGSLTQVSGPIGSLISVSNSSSDLSSVVSAAIGSQSAIVVNKSSNAVTLMVMPGTSNGLISLTSPSGTFSTSEYFTLTPTPNPTTQQGSKVVGTGSTGANVFQGGYGGGISLSADGNTAIVGAPGDNTNVGAAWIFVRSGTSWTQQGSKLVGSGASGAAAQGYAVAISADGNTAVIGGRADNTNTGAIWIFTRSGATWTQQGSKLVGSGASGAARQGSSVAVSADGNTVAEGGSDDNSNAGANWIFTRTGTAWAQQGSKLVGTGASGSAQQGTSIALSSDATTLASGGPADNSFAGAIWIFTVNSGSWTQQGSKLVGTGSSGGSSYQGYGLALSADGATLAEGGSNDNGDIGAAWVFTRSGTTWSQQGSKLTATGEIGTGQFGDGNMSITADGTVILVGAPFDNAGTGAAWVFTRSGTTWSQQGSKRTGTGLNGAAGLGSSVAISSDGTTAICSGETDASNLGATWVFTQ